MMMMMMMMMMIVVVLLVPYMSMFLLTCPFSLLFLYVGWWRASRAVIRKI